MKPFTPMIKIRSRLILFCSVAILLGGCSSSKKSSDQVKLARDMNSTRMKALTKNQDKKKNKAILNAARAKGTTFDKQPYNPYTDVRRDENRKKRVDMDKPQYSDPTYFGHKRKPKKRPPGKQKLCKECGIKH